MRRIVLVAKEVGGFPGLRSETGGTPVLAESVWGWGRAFPPNAQKAARWMGHLSSCRVVPFFLHAAEWPREKRNLPLCENQSLHTQSKFRLLVVRLGAMGDILHALPAATALRQAHPEWEIGWLVEPRWQALLRAEGADGPGEAGVKDQGSGGAGQEPGVRDQGSMTDLAQPLVDRLHFAPVKQWARRPLTFETAREIAALRRELRACAYDAVLDFQGAVRSAVLGRLAGARRRIGEATPRERPARWLFTERVVTQGAHVIEQDVELAAAVAGHSLRLVEPWLPFDPRAEAWCDALLGKDPRPVALLNPGAGWGAKRWPIDRYAQVAKGLADRGLRVLVNAGPGEEPLAAHIQTATAGMAEPLSASLAQLIAVTRRIALCVAGDTGPLHLACALGRPVVGIYGPTDPARNGPFGTRFVVLRSPLSQRDHSRLPEPEAGLLTIHPEEVLRAADTLLKEGENSE
jgi:heptosyltransferase-1